MLNYYDIDRVALISLCIEKMSPDDFDNALTCYCVDLDKTNYELKLMKALLDSNGGAQEAELLANHYRRAAEACMEEKTDEWLVSFLREDEYA